MQTKFIKLKFKDIVQYINPVFITSIVRIGEQCAIHTMDGRRLDSDETVEEVMKKIKEATSLTFTLDK
jgi:uncharacterized protein YlzI (FlbEa/FlbD family)